MATTAVHHAAINTLSLINFPISNQEADWLSKDDDFREFVKSSKIYMIGQREGFVFDIVGHSFKLSNFHLPLAQFFDELGDEFDVGLGPKVISLKNPLSRDHIWFTVEKLLHRFSRGEIDVEFSGNFSKALTFELLYVGISKADDSMTRLFDQGHQSRLKILSNETQKNPNAMLTDELFIFLFNVEDLQIKMFDTNADFNDLYEGKSFEKDNLISDAEKAILVSCDNVDSDES